MVLPDFQSGNLQEKFQALLPKRKINHNTRENSWRFGDWGFDYLEIRRHRYWRFDYLEIERPGDWRYGD